MPFVMSKPTTPRLLVAALAAILPTSAHAQPAPTTVDERLAVELASRHNPTLKAALLDEQQAAALVSFAEDQYPLLMQFDVGATHLRNPSLVTDGVQTSTNDSVVLGAELKKTFPWGTGLNFRTEGSWVRSTSPAVFPGSSELVLGPGWGLLSRLTLVQPLLRGFGTDIGDAELRMSRLDKTAAERARDRAASDLLRETLSAYWELWYAHEAVRINLAARTLAETERAEQQARIDAGATAPAEIYPFEAQVAELDEAVVLAELEREQRALALALQLGQVGDGAEKLQAAAGDPPDMQPLPSVAELRQDARQSSPELAELDVQIAQARERWQIAGEQERARLDLEGWVQIEGLGNDEVPPALEQYATLGALSAHVGLVYEFPVTGSRYDKQRAAAQRAIEVTEARREAVEQQVDNQLSQLISQAKAARQRLRLANRTVEVAQKQRQAAKARFELGEGLAIEIQRAEDTLQRARLRATRARVDWVLATIAIDHLTGRLLRRYARYLPGRGEKAFNGVAPGPY
jgi:outer membrane protein TolC